MAVPVTNGDYPILLAMVDDGFTCLGDYDFHQFVNMSDLFGFLVKFGKYGRFDQDYNQDEDVNVSDLLVHIPSHGDFCDP